MSVCVLGKLYMELAVALSAAPQPGDAIVGEQFEWRAGGSGYLLAASLAKLGVRSLLLGAVGDDRFGERILTAARAAGVDTERVSVDLVRGTGITVQAVFPQGVRTLAVVPGANTGLAEAWFEQGMASEACKALIVELAVGHEAACACVNQSPDGTLIVGHGPPPPRAALPWPHMHVLVATPEELGAVVQNSGPAIDEIKAATAPLLAQGLGQIVVCAGAGGAFLVEADGATHFRAYTTRPQDPAAAREAFTGTLAWALSVGRGPYEAIDLALAAEALTLGRPGAATSLPTLEELVSFLVDQANG